MSEQKIRNDFEAWISAPPFECVCARRPMDERLTSWPGQYHSYQVELAWEAWQAALASPSAKECSTVPDGWRLQSRLRDLLHLLEYATITTPSEGDAHQARQAANDLRAMLKVAPEHKP